MDAPRTLLFDTASLYFRAFFGLPDSLRAKSGDPVNAVRGLLDFLARFITDYSPTHVACCWDDAWRPAWRVDLVPSYKAHRVAYGDVEEVPAALTAQVPWIRATLDALGLPNPTFDVNGQQKHTYTPHSCRHTFATLLKRVPGADKDKLSLIGHASDEQLRYYQDVDLDDLRQITDKI